MIKAFLVDELKEAWDVGWLPTQFQEGMKFLISKVQDVITDAGQLRPITLLNTIYKVLPIYWPKRVKPYLQELIYVGQTGFMENRCIIDNALTFWEEIALAKETNQHIA